MLVFPAGSHKSGYARSIRVPASVAVPQRAEDCAVTAGEWVQVPSVTPKVFSGVDSKEFRHTSVAERLNAADCKSAVLRTTVVRIHPGVLRYFKENIMSNDQTIQEIPIDFKIESRTKEEVLEAIEEFCDKVWFDRHCVGRSKESWLNVPQDIREGAHKAAQAVVDKYGEENLGPYSDFEWGMINGKLSALRWVLGDEWDMLDT